MVKKFSERQRKIDEKNAKKKNKDDFSTPFLSLESLKHSNSEKGELSGQNLKFIYLSGVPKETDVKSVADVLKELEKPPEWANSAHRLNGKARYLIYQGLSKVKAREIARQLEFAGAKLVRC